MSDQYDSDPTNPNPYPPQPPASGEPESPWGAPQTPPPPPGGYEAPTSPGEFAAPPPAPPAAQPPVPPQAPGGFGAPPAPGGYGAPPAPGGFGAPPPPGGGFGGPPPPGQFQQPAQPYYYGQQNTGGTYALASGGKRILARIIDWLIAYVILGGIMVVALFAVLGTSTSSTDEFSTADGVALGGLFVMVIAVMVASVLYEVGFIAVKGATPGKMIMKVQVVRMADGQIPGWGVSFMRWALNLASFVPYIGSCGLLIANIWGLVNLFNHPMRQTPFDMIAKTVVIDKA